MAQIAEVVARSPGAVFAADDGARIVAWNAAAEQGVGLSEAQVLGTPCYETFDAVDVDTGRPCYEQCPLVNKAVRSGWVHSRVLRAGWGDGQPIRLDCMLVRYVLPSSERGALSFITPLGAESAARYLQAITALESLYPLMTGRGNVMQGLGSVTQAVLRATSAEVAELALLDPESGELSEFVRQVADGFTHSSQDPLCGGKVLDMVGTSEAALVTMQDGDESRSCRISVPLFAEERLLGVLTVSSRQPDFSLAFAARVLFAVGGQLSVFLRWALPGSDHPQAGQNEASADAPRLRLYCFGRFRAVLEGQEIPRSGFRRQKSLTLLKLLLTHHGRPLHREMLMDLLWPEVDPSLASNNLRVVLHDLRHTLEPGLPKGQPSSFILSQGDLVYLDPSESCWSDVEEFGQLTKQFEMLASRAETQAALEVGQRALTLYRTDYLEDEPYLDWCIEERERLREIYVNLLQRMGSLQAECGDAQGAIATCRRALASDPVREESHRLLISVLWKDGRRGEAIRQYETCRATLRRELGVEPSDATQAILHAVLAEEVA